jgi:hypothetical protein
LTGASLVCDGDGVLPNRQNGLPDGFLGMVGALVVCAAGATLAIEVGLDAVTSILVALGAAVLASLVIKIGVDMRTARIVAAIAEGDLDPAAAPNAIRRRLGSQHHRATLGRALRRIADDARRYPWQGRLAAPPMVLHFPPATCQRLLQLAAVLESADQVEPRGVAIVEDLVSNPSSPLFGSSDIDVEIEVQRALFLLGVDGA